MDSDFAKEMEEEEEEGKEQERHNGHHRQEGEAERGQGHQGVSSPVASVDSRTVPKRAARAASNF